MTIKHALWAVIILLAVTPALIADGPVAPAPVAATSSTDTHYGLFDWLDHRSEYGQGVFPEPFLVDDSDLEVNEARLDWRHTEAHNQRNDLVTTEIEKGFGLLTLEIEVPYEVDQAIHPSKTTDGFDNIDLGARYPVYQFVSKTGFIDSTCGIAIEVGVPTHSSLSKDTEVVPKVFDDLKVGNLSLQSILGCSMLYGSDEDNGLKTFEYGFVLGYTIGHDQLALPGLLQLIPVFELAGETELNKEEKTRLTGNAAVRINFKTIGPVQPRFGVGYVFPMNSDARADTHWGVITSLLLEY